MFDKEADDSKTMMHGLKWVATFNVAKLMGLGKMCSKQQQINVLSLTVHGKQR